MNYLNCTPHAVVIYDADGKNILATIPPSQWTIRVQTPPQRLVRTVEIEGVSVPVVSAQDFETGEVTGVPPCDEFEQGRTALIVGVIGAEAVDSLWNGPVYVTDTGPESAVRDLSGRILGVRRLQLP